LRSSGEGTDLDGARGPRAGVPQHVAIITDGNGRWAAERGLPRLEGHRAGTKNTSRVIKAFAEQGVRYLTIYAFSTENWSRPEEEVEGLWRLFAHVMESEREHLHAQGVRLRHIGRRDRISPTLLRAIDDAVALTANNTSITLNVALDYGGRYEIVEAVRQIVNSGARPEDVNEDVIAAHMYSAGTPDPDLVIRTGGEMRLSNYLIWQTAYAELYVTQTYWPDFGVEEVRKALEAYSRRQRRFGKAPEQVASPEPEGRPEQAASQR
jgi:undecaprenyl diphosphate synthase